MITDNPKDYYKYLTVDKEVLTPDTLCIPNTDPCIKGRLTKMYFYMCTLHINKYPGIYCTLVNYSLLPSTKYSTPYQE